MIPATSQIGISITTKDRWEDLEVTLTNLKSEGLDSLETIVVDDGSTVPLPSHFATQFPWIKFIRFDVSSGYVAQRNRIAGLLSTPLILQLDDDSFPIAGNLVTATEWLIGRNDVCALAMRVLIGDAPLVDKKTEPPFPVRSFIGCSALIKRELFLAMGGYEECLQFYMEELEFCTKAMALGQETYAYPAIVVRHRVAPGGRNWGYRTRQYARNYVLVCLWYYPFPTSFLRAIRFSPLEILRNSQFRTYWKEALTGSWLGMACYFSRSLKKKRLTPEQFQAWDTLRTVGDGSRI